MFDKERFHNALALSLGYERIVKDRQISIEVEESDVPWVTLKYQGFPEVFRFKASCEADAVETDVMPMMQEKTKHIINMVCLAYKEACSSRF